jgi:hypothetical protein
MVEPPDELIRGYAEVMAIGKGKASDVLKQVASENRLNLPVTVLAREGQDYWNEFFTTVGYGPNVFRLITELFDGNDMPDEERRIVYNHFLEIVRKALVIVRRPSAVANQLKAQRLLSRESPDVESLVRPYLTDSTEPLGVEASKALVYRGKPGVRTVERPCPPGGSFATDAACAVMGGRRRKTTRLPSRLSRRRRSKRSRRNRGNARSL